MILLIFRFYLLILKIFEKMVVLDGELAVLCNLQSAIAGFKSIERLNPRLMYKVRSVEVLAHLNKISLKPVRPGREQR